MKRVAEIIAAIVFLTAVLPVTGRAQTVIPDDPELIKGRLENGLTD